MRDVIFRGKRVDSGEWVEGSLVVSENEINKAYILPSIADFTYGDNGNRIRIGCFVEVVTSTVGQYTGLTDKTGKAIYEGDIVTYPDGDGGYEYCDETISSGVVTWGDESALFYITNNYSAEFQDIWDRVDEMEIIGNIHDNPEYLEPAP